jgi:hypothetical protein
MAQTKIYVWFQSDYVGSGAYQALDAGVYVSYQADPWPCIDSPSDCEWMVPNTGCWAIGTE